jgi:hypothetical protein
MMAPARKLLTRKQEYSMRRIRSKITYANVVATLALFIALGGVSYAAVKLPKNSVGEKQIKKNAVTDKKIKKSTITGDKIKNGTIKGADISLGSLGVVPSAAHAATADNASTVSQVSGVSKRVQSSFTGSTSQDDSRLNATAVPLASFGQVSIYGKCYIYSGSLYAETYARTTADGAIDYGGSYSYYGGGGYLNTSTPEGQRYLSYASTGSNSANYNGSYFYGSLFGPDGNGLNWQLQIWVKQGTVSTYDNGAYGAGNVCVFNANAVHLPAS